MLLFPQNCNVLEISERIGREYLWYRRPKEKLVWILGRLKVERLQSKG